MADSTSEEAKEAFFQTGGIPHELNLLWKQPEKTLREKTQLYQRNRFRDIATGHRKFCDSTSEERKLNLRKCISCMALEQSPPESLDGMDRQLFDIIEHPVKGRIIVAINPIARRAMLHYHRDFIKTTFGDAAEELLRS